VRVAIGKLPGVESVDVSLERAMTEVRLKPGNSITLPQLRQVIRNNGFNPKEATVTALGSLIQREGQPAFEVSGIGTVWLLAPDERDRGVYDEAAKRARAPAPEPVEIVGVVAAPVKASDADRIAVQRVTPPGSGLETTARVRSRNGRRGQVSEWPQERVGAPE
jgi:hypothetical protein